MPSELQQIIGSIQYSLDTGNKNMLSVSIQDLKDISKEYETLELECRYVAINGGKILASAFLPNELKIREVNGIKNHVLINKYKKVLESHLPTTEFFKYFKHLNDMSPDEYSWCHGIE